MVRARLRAKGVSAFHPAKGWEEGLGVRGQDFRGGVLGFRPYGLVLSGFGPVGQIHHGPHVALFLGFIQGLGCFGLGPSNGIRFGFQNLGCKGLGMSDLGLRAGFQFVKAHRVFADEKR